MISEKMQHVATIVAVLLGGVSLSLVVDSRIIMYVILAVTALISGFYAWFAVRKQLTVHSSLHRIAATFFVWCAFSSVFAARSFQLISTPLLILCGALLAACAALLWVWSVERHKMLSVFLGVLTFEWFIIFLFGPANYMVLGGLLTVAFTSTALLFGFQTDSVTRRDVARHIIITLLISFIFILGFRWVL